MKKRVCLGILFALVLLVVFSSVYVIAVSSEAELNASYNLGKDLAEFMKLDAATQAKILSSDEKVEAFMRGYFEAVKKDPKKEDEFLDFWIDKNDKKENKLGDKAKNKIWQYLSKSKSKEAEDYFKKIANKLFKKIYPDKLFQDPSKLGIKEVMLKDPSKLFWNGNKVGITKEGSKDQNLYLWLDLDNLPVWMTKIKFENGKFDCEFNSDNGIKNIAFKGGSISALGELIGPDGKIIGTRMNEDIQGIKFDSQKREFEIKYKYQGQEKSIKLNENDLPQGIRESLQKALNNPNIGPKLQEILGSLNGVGVDFTTGGVPTQNKLNVLYGGNKDVAERIEIDYNDKGEPKVDLSKGGTLVTTDAKGKVERVYRQWYSGSGVVDSRLNSDDWLKEYNQNNPKAQLGDENGVFLFDKSGNIEASKNGRIEVSGFGTAYTSRIDYVGVDIVRNSFIDAVARGDRKAIMEAVFAKGTLVIDPFLDIVKNGDPKAAITLQGVQSQLLGILKSELEDPNLAIEYKSKINEVISSVINNLQNSGESLFDSALGFNSGKLTEDEQRMRDWALRRASTEVESAVSELLLNPDKVKELLKQDPTATNEFIKSYLKSRVSAGVIDPIISNTLTDSIVDLIRANGGSLSSDSVARLTREQVTKLIENTDFSAQIRNADKQGGDYRESLRQAVLGSDFLKAGSLTDEQKKGAADIILQLVSDAEGRVKQEKANFEKQFLQDRKQLGGGAYEDRIIIDTYLNRVYAQGNERIVFDAKVPLVEFDAKSTRSGNDHPLSTIELWSGGYPVVSFDGAETKVFRIVGNYPYVDVENIVNLADPNKNAYLRLEKNGYYGYRLYYPESLTTIRKDITGGFRRANPIVGSTITKPIDADIGSNPDSKITLFDTTDEMTGIFGGRLKRKLVQGRLPDGFPVGMIGDRGLPAFDKAFSFLTTGNGPETIREVNQFLASVRETGAQIPLPVEDMAFTVNNPESIRTMLSFMKTAANKPRSNYLEITPSYISVNGNQISTFTDKNGQQQSLAPALRTFMRAYDVAANQPYYTPFRHYHPSEAKQLQ